METDRVTDDPTLDPPIFASVDAAGTDCPGADVAHHYPAASSTSATR